ncbi:hypothetical protein NM688_g9218 [Phlebia brevispora]|uniref:Uncharacterized protein n=1 Tax=Phlebia brevispora TaxID=194682 RepID=A0ACC1RMB9_9APHY|nr:hypothetical protein NM688_g9218 [Phlebia brevispora]
MSTSQLPPIPSTIAQLSAFSWSHLQLGPVRRLDGASFGTTVSDIYYIAFPKDRTLPKVIVSVVYILELAQTVLSTRDSFRNFGTGWGNIVDLNTVGWLWFSVPVLGSIICCIGQLFYAWRIWILSHKSYMTVVIVLIALVQLGTGVYSGAVAHIIGDFSERQSLIFRLLLPSLITLPSAFALHTPFMF